VRQLLISLLIKLIAMASVLSVCTCDGK